MKSNLLKFKDWILNLENRIQILVPFFLMPKNFFQFSPKNRIKMILFFKLQRASEPAAHVAIVYQIESLSLNSEIWKKGQFFVEFASLSEHVCFFKGLKQHFSWKQETFVVEWAFTNTWQTLSFYKKKWNLYRFKTSTNNLHFNFYFYEIEMKVWSAFRESTHVKTFNVKQ